MENESNHRKNKLKNTIISLGGSVFVDEQINVKYLESLKKKLISTKNRRFHIVCGGGLTARKYQQSLKKGKYNSKALDLIGILCTKLNAELVKIVFSDFAHKIICDTSNIVPSKKRVIIYAGEKTGHSTDYDAVLIAKKLEVKVVYNLTNIDGVYSDDPKKRKNATLIRELTWREYLNMFDINWIPGMHSPFDVKASILAHKNNIKVLILNGKKLNNLTLAFNDKKHIGTVICNQ